MIVPPAGEHVRQFCLGRNRGRQRAAIVFLAPKKINPAHRFICFQPLKEASWQGDNYSCSIHLGTKVTGMQAKASKSLRAAEGKERGTCGVLSRNKFRTMCLCLLLVWQLILFMDLIVPPSHSPSAPIHMSRPWLPMWLPLEVGSLGGNESYRKL